MTSSFSDRQKGNRHLVSSREYRINRSCRESSALTARICRRRVARERSQACSILVHLGAHARSKVEALSASTKCMKPLRDSMYVKHQPAAKNLLGLWIYRIPFFKPCSPSFFKGRISARRSVAFLATDQAVIRLFAEQGLLSKCWIAWTALSSPRRSKGEMLFSVSLQR